MCRGSSTTCARLVRIRAHWPSEAVSGPTVNQAVMPSFTRQPRGWPQTQGGSSEMSRPIPREKSPVETATAPRGAVNGRTSSPEVNGVLIEDDLITEDEESDEGNDSSDADYSAEPGLVPAVDDLAAPGVFALDELLE